MRVTGVETLGKSGAVLALLDESFLDDTAELVAALVESQIRHRILSEKTAPDGGRWKPWSAAYAKTRHGNQSLLVDSGNLHDSIEGTGDRYGILVGSNLVYAQRQNADRTYLGVSVDNAREIERAIGAQFEAIFQ